MVEHQRCDERGCVVIPRIFVDEPCPLEGYGDLAVRVLANASDAAWRQWATGSLGTPGCPDCAALPDGQRCPACTAARTLYGQAIVTLYGPTLLGHDVSTPEAALALFDDDAALPSELVIWLQLVPGTVRQRRTEALLPNLTGSATTRTS